VSASIFQCSVYYVNEIIAAAKVTGRRRIVNRLAGVAYVVLFSQNSHSGTQEHDPE